MEIPRLVVFDVDGTLLDWSNECRPATRDAVAQLQASGVLVAIATGRPMYVADQTLAQVGTVGWMACGNGSVVFEVATGTVLRDSCLPSEIVAPVIEGLRARLPGIGFTIEAVGAFFEEAGFAQRVPEPSVQAPVPDVLASWQATQPHVRRIIPFHDDYDANLFELAAIVEEFVDDRCDVHAFGGLPIVDISPVDNHKAAGLQDLVDHLGMEASDVMAFGDGGNDIEMLQWAGTGVAMGNAALDVQQAADLVADHVEHGGVANFLKPLLDSL